MYELASRLFPLCRSLTGNGVRETLSILAESVPVEVHEVESGTEALDWTVPDEWNIRDAYVADENGRRIIDFQENNLHVLGYSVPFDGMLTLEELKPHLFSLPDQPVAIPYLTSYYEPRWGFCLPHRKLEALEPGTYHVKIASTLKPGAMSYAELLLPGETSKEVLLSTYVCHPSMANDNLSGVVVTLFLAKYLAGKAKRRHTYRVLFLPETLGPIAYLSRHKKAMVDDTVAGFVVTCVGDPGPFTYLQSRREETLADRAAEHVLRQSGQDFSILDYTHRQSDERQYCSPGIDLPVGSVMRTRYGSYPEYHTSLDNLDFITADALQGSLEMYRTIIEAIEANRTYQATVTGGEPQLGRRGLYPTIGGRKDTTAETEDLMALLSYCDGQNDLIAIANKHRKPIQTYFTAVEALLQNNLIRPLD